MPEMKYSRRTFLISSATLVGGAMAFLQYSKKPKSVIPGRILGANSKIGHKLREGGFPSPSETQHSEVAIVGGGIAGLSAARRLKKAGHEDFQLLELDHEPGGNSISGKNEISAYPWGAHYVPLPSADNLEVIRLFEELGIIVGYDKDHLPIYDEFYLCSDPTERLFLHGAWQEGLIPQVGTSDSDRRQYQEFFSAMENFKSMKGRDGKTAFSIPVDSSSQDPELIKLDAISMDEYMDRHHWNSEPLRWYINYCCRDDYGAESKEVSAWAGIHYFASRRGKASNAPAQTVVTWPEGNGWLAKKLKEAVHSKIRTSALVFNVEKQVDGSVAVDYFDIEKNSVVRIRSKAVVFAAPRFVANHVVKSQRQTRSHEVKTEYSPWMVANISLDYLPHEEGAPLSWDNVLYRSDSLGYVDATHQDLKMRPRKTVLTYYMPLSSKSPSESRAEALGKKHDEWCDFILKDLSHAHPDIESHVQNIDVWLWGHGMIRPKPGFIWGEGRKQLLLNEPPVYYAHSDMSGISIFEEAYIRGVHAADEVLKNIRAA